jgi:tetratricopeptide (TPR) repeat protein
VRLLAHIAALGSLALAAGCGTVHDMRAEYVANRALADALSEAGGAAPQVTTIVADLDVAYRLRGRDPRVAQRLAGLYHQFGRYEQALRCYETAPGRYELEIAVCRLGAGRTDEALAEIDRLMAARSTERHPGGVSGYENAAVLNLVGYTMLDKGVRVKDACAMVQEAVRLMPLESAYVDSLGWGYYRLGEYRTAAFYLERAARLSPQESAEELWHLGAVHARLGQHRRATSELARSVKLDPSNALARQALERLQHELPPPARV